MKKEIWGVGFSLLFVPFFAVQAADFSGDVVNTTEGEYMDALEKTAPFVRHEVELANGEATLAQDEDGNYLTTGSIKRDEGILKQHYFYFDSAAIEIDADLPEGTSVDLYLRTTDPDGEYGVHTRARKWTEVVAGEKIDLHSFHELYGGEGHYSSYQRNNLRWKAVLHSDDPTVTPTLYSVTLTFYEARPKVEQLEMLQNVVGVNRTEGATAKITLTGKGFQENSEEVFLKNLFAANAVTYIDSRTLVAEVPIEALSAGTYTVMVRNTETGRMYKTDVNGNPVEQPHGQADPANLRLVLKWFAPTIDSISPTHVPYADGDTLIISGSYFSYGSRVTIAPAQDLEVNLEDGIFLPADSITLLDEHTMQIDLTSGIITSYGLDRDTNLTVLVRTPDYQTVSQDGFYVD